MTLKIDPKFEEKPICYFKNDKNLVNFDPSTQTCHKFALSLVTIVQSIQRLTIITRNNIVWKLARGYYLCYCKTFSLVPNSTECTNFFLSKCAVHYLYHLKSNNIINQRKTTNTEKHLYP